MVKQSFRSYHVIIKINKYLYELTDEIKKYINFEYSRRDVMTKEFSELINIHDHLFKYMVYIRDEIIKKNEEDFKKSFKLDRFKKAK
jgi:hypothetical protein